MDSPYRLDKSLDSTHDLSRGERSYLKEQGISAAQFDKMDNLSKREWKDECREPHYESMRGYKGRK